MKLSRVTLTGADDLVNPIEMGRLSEEFPWIEWGILFSRKRAGTARYPSAEWIARLQHVYGSFAAHLCGEEAKEALRGNASWFGQYWNWRFQRVQINGWEPGKAEFIALARVWRGFQFILQAQTETHLEDAAREVQAIGRGTYLTNVLYDPSGGRGLAPFRWPPIPLAYTHLDPAVVGYAGGITPENVVETIVTLQTVNVNREGKFWIDLESGVRDEKDQFSFERARALLRAAAPFIQTL
jgi:phosphoribosylanthranilate isomerase